MKREPNRQPKTFTKTKKIVATGSGRSAASPDLDWYDKGEEDLHEHVFGRVRQIKNSQTARRYELYTYQQAYNSRFGPAAMASLYSPASRNSTAGMFGVSANVIKSCVDTGSARIAKEKPRAFCLPNKGDYRLKRKALQLTKFLDGVLQNGGVYAGSDDVFRDAELYGTGYMLIDGSTGEVRGRVLKIDEVHIDAVDGMYDDPTEIHWSHAVLRRDLLAEYPDRKADIDAARSSWRGEMAFMGAADMIEVVRSWKLPSKAGKGQTPGVHSISIATATLLKEEWKYDYLPIARFHWTPPTYGPFGDGMAKELFGAQRVVSDVLRGIVKSIKMFAVPRVWVSKLANVTSQMITNEMGVNEYAGEKPVFETPAAASADIYQFAQWVIDWCYKQVGLSQLTAQSEKPAGLNSGVAMRTYQDVETQRFALVGQRWERYYMQLARMAIDCAADIYKDKGKLSVKIPGRGFIETIDWKAVALKEDQCDWQIWPTNILPETPEGRMQAVQEFVNSGFMPKDVALAQLRIPILNDWVDQETAARDNIERCLSAIVERSKFIPPLAIDNIDLAVTMAQGAIIIAIDEEVDPHKVDMLWQWLGAALQQQAAKNAPPAPPPGAPAPGGAVVGQAPAPPPAPMAPAGAGPVSMPAQAA